MIKQKQDRQTINLPIAVYDELSYLQSEVRVFMKEQKIEKIRSKTSMTNVIKALIKNTNAKELTKMLK